LAVTHKKEIVLTTCDCGEFKLNPDVLNFLLLVEAASLLSRRRQLVKCVTAASIDHYQRSIWQCCHVLGVVQPWAGDHEARCQTTRYDRV